MVAVPSFGYSSIAADRGVQIGTANTSDALIAIEQYDVTVSDQNQAEEILVLTNNLDEDVTLGVEVSINEAGLQEADGFDGALMAGASTNYAVTCESGSGGGETEVEVTVHSAVSDSTTISGITETYQIPRDCPGPGGPPSGSPPAEDVYEITQQDWIGERGYEFEVTNQNVGNPRWDFGDGRTESEWYVQHEYAADGTYPVELTVEIDGEDQTYTEYLEVNTSSPPPGEKPPAEEVYTITQPNWMGDRGYEFEITAENHNVANPQWDFGDGRTESGWYFQHTYNTDGTYEVKVTVDIDGDQYVYTETLDVNS